MLSQDQNAKIKEYCANKPIEVVYLFGSQASGNERPDSDYDFGVIFEEKLQKSVKSELRFNFQSKLTDILGTDNVDVLDLPTVYLRFQYEVIKARKEIYVKSKKIRDEFEYRVLVDYLDEMYYMKQATRDRFKYFARSL